MIFQVEKWPGQPVAYWSTCAYLINKAVMKPIVDEILKVGVSVSICVLVLPLFFLLWCSLTSTQFIILSTFSFF